MYIIKCWAHILLARFSKIASKMFVSLENVEISVKKIRSFIVSILFVVCTTYVRNVLENISAIYLGCSPRRNKFWRDTFFHKKWKANWTFTLICKIFEQIQRVLRKRNSLCDVIKMRLEKNRNKNESFLYAIIDKNLYKFMEPGSKSVKSEMIQLEVSTK